MGATDSNSEIRADFLVEAREIVDQLGEQMVVLERAPEDRDALNLVFRGFHTIKGGAGFLDFPPMVTLCHAVEDRLDVARNGAMPLDGFAFDGAQQAIDLLADMLECIAVGQPLPGVPQVLIDSMHVDHRTSPTSQAAIVASDLPDNLDELDFDSLLDALHGKGALPGAAPASEAPALAAVAPAPSPTEVARPEPMAHGRRSPAANDAGETTVRVDVRRLDAMVNLVGELVLARNRLKTIRPRLRDEDLDRAVSVLDAATSRLQSAVMTARMQPVGRVFSRFPKLARDVARQVSKSVELDVVGAETELDRNLVEALSDPLVHLVRNAIDHGIESPEARRAAGKNEVGSVRLSAQQEGDHVMIEVRDDGAGIDPEKIRDSAIRKGLVDAESAARLSADECLQLIFMPGFSTRAEVTDLSGRGVGMDVVQSRIRELSGSVQIQSDVGRGTRMSIKVPLTLAILPTLLVEIDGDVYALPLVRVIEVLAHDSAKALWIDGQSVLDLREQPTPVLDLRHWLGVEPSTGGAATGVVLQAGEQRFVLIVDRVRGREEVVIKALPRTLRGLAGYAGASLIGDGRMALILDVDALHESGVRTRRIVASA
ncbi:chemotaxis protein CheA [Cognatilysobacter lacus]|uniref:Chemotaxis protein CheA n=1 Tax=Cognatilysobacter lacus TaxID=1643323 RepID=A0A5D8Z2V6_9GAMM|nr:chemotaxis protein CheA [Lysobacter lacus]TZF88413.1 chemotaxis protein CheA [Lysobacter lacus]